MCVKVIKSSAEISLVDWQQFVQNHKQGNVFHLPGFYRVLEETKNYKPLCICSFSSTGAINGILLAMYQSDYFPPISLLTGRMIVFGGPIALNDNPDIKKKLLDCFNKTVRKNAIYSQFRNFEVQNDNDKKLFEELKFTYHKHLNILVDLTCSTEELWEQVKKTRKRGINKALRHDFRFTVTENDDFIEPFYQLLKTTYKRIGLPYPDVSFFYSLNKYLPENVKWFILSLADSNLVMIMIALVFNNRIYGLYVGSGEDIEILNLRPADLFYWKVINWGKENGFATFDWMGAGEPDKEYGVRDFKLQYGGKLIEPGRYLIINKPATYRFSLFLFKLWKKILV